MRPITLEGDRQNHDSGRDRDRMVFQSRQYVGEPVHPLFFSLRQRS